MKTLFNLLVNPGQVARYQNHSVKKLYWKSAKFLSPFEVHKREKAALQLSNPKVLEDINPKIGASFQNSKSVIALTKKAVDESWHIIKQTDLNITKSKSYLKPLLSKDDIKIQSAITNLAISDELLSVVTNYLGIFPILYYINIWFTPGKENQNEYQGSQLFHLDHEDYKQLKVFIYLNDMEIDHGPTQYISAENSKEYVLRFSYNTKQQNKNIPDSQLTKYKKIVHLGKKGSIVLMDTSNCFHCGGRSKKDRFLLVFQYLTPFAFVKKSYQDRRLLHLLKSRELSTSFKRFAI